VRLSALRRFVIVALGILLSMFNGAAVGAVHVHIVKPDLQQLIQAAVDTPTQFAVPVPNAVSASTGGTWTTAGDRATWTYAVQVPTAVSLSFHATQSELPDSAILVVQGGSTTTSYRARDLHRGELWSRIHPGNTLGFTLTVPAADRAKVALNIVSLQVGYRSVGAGVADHPIYRQLKAKAAAASGNQSCVTNYECKVTTANTPAGAATVGLVVGNLYQCTGTLINNVPNDNTPYVLTARHCETGKLGGGNPGAAATVTVYWDATTICGSELGSLYDPNIATQSGAKTVVEQQDAWLIRLDATPIIADAQFAGFDASGGAVSGGYTIHHAEGFDKQFTGWAGQAAVVQETDVLTSHYLSNFLETVNAIGNIGPGASGSALFNQNNRIVGTLSLGHQTTDTSGYESCPVPTPPAPNGSNGAADFTSLAAVWNSTADTTSTTGSATLKTILDPGNTGALSTPSSPAAYVTFNATAQTLSIGQSVTLSWNAVGAAQCTANDGVSGDGWSGALATAGSKSLSESAANLVTYTLHCGYADGRVANAHVTISWLGPYPQVQLNAPSRVWTDAPVTLSWTSNVTPCSISGGSLSQSNLPGTGTLTTTQSTAADVNYILTCGPPNQLGNSYASVIYETPSLVFAANGTDRLMATPFFLVWTTSATQCTPSGGAPGDGWTNTEFTGFYATSGEPFYLTVTTPGTYTYTLTCSAGPNSLQRSVTVTFENNAPYVTLALDQPTVTLSTSPADFPTLTWTTNLAACGFNVSPYFLVLSEQSNPYLSDGRSVLTASKSGTYQITAYCFPTLSTGPYSATATVTLTVLPPPAPTATISLTPATIVAGQPINITWSSTNAVNCTQTGGIPAAGWGDQGNFGFATAGTVTETAHAGQYTFGITCAGIDPNQVVATAQANVTIAPSATLTADSTSVTEGKPITLTWSSDGATACIASGGGADGSTWSGSIAASGSVTEMTSAVGTFTYTLSCSDGDLLAAPQQLTVNVTAPASSTGSGSTPTGGGKGGGGAFGWLELLVLASLQAAYLTRRPLKAAPFRSGMRRRCSTRSTW